MADTKHTGRLDRQLLTWVALGLATVLSFWIGTSHRVSSARLSAAIVVAVGIAKAWLVIRSFMESGAAGRGMRIAFDVWALATGVGLVVALIA